MTAAYTEQKNLPYDAWWKTFHDPVLDELIKKGLKHNLDMRITLNHLEEARGLLKQIQLSWIPTPELLAGYSTNPAIGIPGAFYGLWAFYAINIAKLINQQRIATFNVDYHCAMVDGMRLTVVGQLASAYFTLIAQQEQLRLLRILDKDMNKLIQFCRDDIHIGLRNNIDLATFLIKEKQVKTQIEVTQHNIVLSQNALRFLLNENPGPIKSGRSFNTFDFTRLKPGSLPVSVLRNRPDVRMAAFTAKASKAALSAAYSDFFPIMQLDQFVGQAKRAKSSIASLTDSYLNATLSPSTFGAISAQKGAHKAAVNAFLRTIKNSLREVDNDFSANQRYSDYFLLTKAAEHDYKDKYQLQKNLLKAGLLSDNGLVDSKVQYDELALLTNQARLQLAMTLVLLYQDLAGGYKTQQ